MHELLLPTSLARAEAIAHCRLYLSARVRRWRLAQLFLPADLREDLTVLLAWHRLGREIAEESSGFERRRGLDELESELSAAMNERASSPVGLALSFVARRHELSEELLRRPLLEWRRDEHLSTFETRAELLGHARALAVPEGRLLLGVAGLSNPRNEALVDALAIAIQLSVWLANLRRDLARGRLRFPMDQLNEHGVEIQALLAGRSSPGLDRAVAEQIARTREHFARGWELCRVLSPRRARPLAFVLRWHAATLSAIEAAHYDALLRQPRAGWPRLIACASASLIGSAPPRLN